MGKTIADTRLLELLDYLKQTGRIRFVQEFLDSIEMSKQSFTHIKTGRQSFTILQIREICDIYDVNANWVFGLESNMFRAINH